MLGLGSLHAMVLQISDDNIPQHFLATLPGGKEEPQHRGCREGVGNSVPFLPVLRTGSVASGNLLLYSEPQFPEFLCHVLECLNERS